MIDQSSTHGTYVNGEKLIPFLPRDVFDGDCITLGTILEATGRSTAQHLPTDLEVGIMEIDGRTDIDSWMPAPAAAAATTTTTTIETRNSFHPPQDSDSESEEEPQPQPQPIRSTWKPFASRPDIDIIVPESHLRAEPFIREHSSSTSINIELPAIHQQPPQQPQQSSPLIDLTTDNPWVISEPVHMECIEVNSDQDGEYDEEEEYYDDEEEEDEDDEERSDYGFPYEYSTEAKESVNEQTQIPETQSFHRMENPPITVSPFL